MLLQNVVRIRFNMRYRRQTGEAHFAAFQKLAQQTILNETFVGGKTRKNLISIELENEYENIRMNNRLADKFV